MCSEAARGGYLGVLQWAQRGPMAATGMRPRAIGRHMVGTLHCCSGRGPAAATGTRPRAVGRREVGTMLCCSGRGPTVATRTRKRAVGRREAGMPRCVAVGAGQCMAATGTRTRAHTVLVSDQIELPFRL